MALGTTSAGGIVLRAAILMTAATRCNSGQQNVSGSAAFRSPVVTRRARQQAMGVVTEFSVQEPASRNRRLRNRWQWPITFDHNVAEFAAFVE